MKTTKFQVAVLIVSVFCFIGTIGVMFFMNQADKQTESTTKLYSATVDSIQITDDGKNISVDIHTKEYKNTLYISTNIAKSINIADLSI